MPASKGNGSAIALYKMENRMVTAPLSKERGFQDLSPDLAAPRSKYIVLQMLNLVKWGAIHPPSKGGVSPAVFSMVFVIIYGGMIMGWWW